MDGTMDKPLTVHSKMKERKRNRENERNKSKQRKENKKETKQTKCGYRNVSVTVLSIDVSHTYFQTCLHRKLNPTKNKHINKREREVESYVRNLFGN